MSAAAQLPTPTSAPDRATTDKPGRLGRVLCLVRKLIDYGKNLANTVQQRAAARGFAFFARPFGTADLAVILARITNGLRRAAVLEAALIRRAARGRDLTPTPIRLPAARGPRSAPQSRPRTPSPNPSQATTPRTRVSRACPRKMKSPPRFGAGLSAPSSPTSAVTSASPGHLDRAFWDELRHAITMYGGSLVSFFGNLDRRLAAFCFGDLSDRADPGWPTTPARSPAPSTGPP